MLHKSSILFHIIYASIKTHFHHTYVHRTFNYWHWALCGNPKAYMFIDLTTLRQTADPRYIWAFKDYNFSNFSKCSRLLILYTGLLSVTWVYILQSEGNWSNPWSHSRMLLGHTELWSGCISLAEGETSV